MWWQGPIPAPTMELAAIAREIAKDEGKEGYGVKIRACQILVQECKVSLKMAACAFDCLI